MKKTKFTENLLRKIEIDRLAAKVTASCGSGSTRRPVDKENMRRLLEMSPYEFQHERDLDLYVKTVEGALPMIMVLDNELPIFQSTVKDVTVRRSPRTLDLWSIRNIRNILVDSDIKLSSKDESVETVRKDAIGQLDLTYTDADIENLAQEGIAWLAGRNAKGVEKSLTLFAAMLGFQKPPRPFELEQTVSFGDSSTGPDNEAAFGPLVLYSPGNNILVWIDQSLASSDRQQMDFLRSVAAGETSVPLRGNAVFEKLQAIVLERPQRVVL
ncbi:MAG: hypothetical protein KKE17_10825 [Proteobacteria bacterium]|nr:hypothetical protein [Pseudomonadota bacterium]